MSALLLVALDEHIISTARAAEGHLKIVLFDVYVHVYVYVCVYIYIYIYIYRERERNVYTHIYTYIYIYIYICACVDLGHPLRWQTLELEKPCLDMFCFTANPPTSTVDFREFDSSILLI